MEVSEVVALAKVVLSQWQAAQDKNFNQSWGLIDFDDGDEHWTLPTGNKTKVNTDAAIFQASSCFSFAYAARDQDGKLIKARASCKQGQIQPESAEAIGIREALSWIKDKGLTDVIVETDCLVAVQAIRSSKHMVSYFGRIIQQCKSLLSKLQDKGITLRFVKRSANGLAHHLASCSHSTSDRIWGPNEVDPDLIHVLENDLK